MGAPKDTVLRGAHLQTAKPFKPLDLTVFIYQLLITILLITWSIYYIACGTFVQQSSQCYHLLLVFQ